ncbi:MAG: hypothetical protein Q8N98_05345 [bacterium]|nr:hypothetical protein [bacterium]
MSRTVLFCGGDYEDRLKEIGRRFGENRLFTPSPDFFSPEEKDSIGIEEVRKLRRWLTLKPFSSSEKTVVFNRAERLTVEAQNAFLKTLEEPPDNTIIILSCQAEETLLPTVVSRCEIIRINGKLYSGDSDKKIEEDFKILRGNDIGEKFRLAAEIAVNREETKRWLEKMILFSHQSLLNSPSSSLLPLLPPLSLLQSSYRLVSQNINFRLATENLLLYNFN